MVGRRVRLAAAMVTVVFSFPLLWTPDVSARAVEGHYHEWSAPDDVIVVNSADDGVCSNGPSILARESAAVSTTSQAPSKLEVETGDASNIMTHMARLNGTLVSLGSAKSADVSFQWGTVPGSYAGKTVAQTMNSTGSFYLDLSGLTPKTRYYFRAMAVDRDTAYGTEKSFTSGAASPMLDTNDATNVTATGARLNGNLIAVGTVVSANVSFQWGTSPVSYANETLAQSVNTTGAFYSDLGGLAPNTVYYFRAKAVGHGTSYGPDKSFSTSAVLRSGGGGDLGGGGVDFVAPVPGVTYVTPYTNYEGVFNLAALLKSEDGRVNLGINKGVRGRTSDGHPLKSIKIVPADNMESAPDAPASSKFVGRAYEITPDGARFSPSIAVTIFYDPAGLPQDIDMDSLSIVVQNEKEPRWDLLTSLHSKPESSVTASVEHFSVFALVGKIATPSPPPIPVLPGAAEFMVSGLAVTPSTCGQGQQVTVSAKASNAGEIPGQYDVILTIDGVVGDTKRVFLEPGESTPVTFTVSRTVPGTYQIDVNGSKGSITVEESSPPATLAAERTYTKERVPERVPLRAFVVVLIMGVVLIGGAIWYVRLKGQRSQ